MYTTRCWQRPTSYHSKANVKTVAEVRKHDRTRGPPHTLINDEEELLRFNTRDILTVLTGFFTKWSILMRQETELNNSIQEQ
jgi:hypothetical protein